MVGEADEVRAGQSQSSESLGAFASKWVLDGFIGLRGCSNGARSCLSAVAPRLFFVDRVYEALFKSWPLGTLG